jgi:hypothetical protein
LVTSRGSKSNLKKTASNSKQGKGQSQTQMQREHVLRPHLGHVKSVNLDAAASKMKAAGCPTSKRACTTTLSSRHQAVQAQHQQAQPCIMMSTLSQRQKPHGAREHSTCDKPLGMQHMRVSWSAGSTICTNRLLVRLQIVSLDDKPIKQTVIST